MPRVKICGITRPEDGVEAARLGADAIGLVFYDKSPRYVSLETAHAVLSVLPPFISIVALFVNPTRAAVETVLAALPIDILQFHGDETPDFCRSFQRSYLKAMRMRPGIDLQAEAACFTDARGLLVDAFVDGVHGGTGVCFDWSLLPTSLPISLILSGGLDEKNVADAVRQVRPAAVDVSSGVEISKGIKDASKMAAFIQGAKYGSI